MGKTPGRKASGQSRTMAVSLRLTPRTHYGLDLLARKRHTTLTSVVEWAVVRSIADAVDGLVERNGDKTVNILDETWDVDECDRFVNLAQNYPALLRFDEDRLWKAIRENPRLWSGKAGPRRAALREQWPNLTKQFLTEKG